MQGAVLHLVPRTRRQAESSLAARKHAAGDSTFRRHPADACTNSSALRSECEDAANPPGAFLALAAAVWRGEEGAAHENAAPCDKCVRRRPFRPGDGYDGSAAAAVRIHSDAPPPIIPADRSARSV
jgi:hypothetical protein